MTKTILTNALTNTNLDFSKIEITNLLKEIESRIPATYTNQELIDLIATYTNSKSLMDHKYSYLSSRIIMQNIHNTVELSFSKSIENQYNEIINGQASPRIDIKIMEFVISNADTLDKIIKIEQDYIFDYSQLQSYLKSSLRYTQKGLLAETPQQMFLRVAVGLFSQTNKPLESKLIEIQDYYNQLSELKISPQSPIIVHAGSKHNQMPSCYLQYCEDSMCGGDEYEETGIVNGILGAVVQMGQQGKAGGATGINISDVRSNGSFIKKTGGRSNGILPFMKIFDAAIGAINQGGRRAGVCALYIEPWHADILDFLGAGEHFTTEEKRCKNLFFALYTNDLFFERMLKDGKGAKWTLFDPATIREHLEGKSLSDFYGKEFEEAYVKLEALGIGKTVLLDDIWSKVCHLIKINGNPYIVHKDSINTKSNQQNQGTIKGSNVCCEVTLVSDKDNTGVCVLSSIALPKFINTETREFDFFAFMETVKLTTRSLNNVLDIQHYPTVQTRKSALNSRAIGIGIQGLADVFAMLELDFDSEQAKKVNKAIYETLYYASLVESCQLAKDYGTYSLYAGSPVSQGILQHDMWGIKDSDTFLGEELWRDLRNAISQYGIRNSELTALMPTASSSIRMGNTEMHEPFTRNIFVRRYIGGESLVVNQHLVKSLIKLDLWNENLANKIIVNKGSIQDIDTIPDTIKSRFRTAYELPHKELTKMMADRSAFITQSASYNHYVNKEKLNQLEITSRVLFAWKKGLKTLSYYFHSEASATGKQEMGGVLDTAKTCNINNPDCESCQA